MTALAELLGGSAGIVAARATVERLLARRADARRLPSILIQGETGTGKGLLARAIHRAGPRADGPYVTVNCAAIPETLLEAELFGYEKGAFTDARQAKPGLFQTAHRGTLFLDEVGLLPLALQAKLLTALDERTVRRLGATRTEPFDVQLIAATNDDLAGALRARRFREDLYHRLSVVTLTLPALRERGGDVLLLAEHFLRAACADYGLPAKSFTPEAAGALQRYHWPGNVRELANVVEGAALLTEESRLDAASLALPATAGPASGGRRGETTLGEAVGSVERDLIAGALRATGGNISRASARLGVPRNTLRYRIERLGLRVADLVTEAAGPDDVEGPAAIAPPEPGVPRPAPALWEPRHVVVLGAVLPAAADAEGRGALQILAERAESFGGRIEGITPGGFMVAFGLEPTEDAPTRAALAAMAIQRAAGRSRQGLAPAAAVRIALHVDQYFVNQGTTGPRLDLDAQREAWSLLRTALDGAEDGSIVVSGAAMPFLRRRFELRDTGERSGVRLYRLAGRERAELGPGGRLAAFVGRSDELALLERRLTLARGGRGQVVAVVGEAGIGKSRLLYEFRQDAAAAGAACLTAQCWSYATTAPLGPVADLVRQAWSIGETDGAITVANRLNDGLEDLGLESKEATPVLLRLLGITEGTDALAGLTPEVVRTRSFDTMIAVVQRLSRRQPLVIQWEDLHWIDQSSQAWLAALVDRIASAAVLVVATYRPGYRPSWNEKSYATQIALSPLALDESRRLVDSVAQRLPDALAGLILARAEGNPFFLEELALTVTDAAPDDAASAIPETVHGVLAARIDRLPEAARRLLQTASVLGREFSLRLLAAIADEPPEPHLRELERLEFVVGASRSDEPAYAFKHALTQEVAYESLAATRRTALHEAAAHALEGLHHDRLEDVEDRLAFHYAQTDRSDKAVAYLTRVAESNARGYAHAEAAAALERARGHAERLGDEARILELSLRLAFSYSVMGRFEDILSLLLPQQERVVRLAQPALAGPYYFRLGLTYSLTYKSPQDLEQAAVYAERARAESRRCGDFVTEGKAEYVLGLRAYQIGTLRPGVRHCARAVELLGPCAERHWLGLAYWMLGLNQTVLGDFPAALEAAARVAEIGQAMGDPRLQSLAFANAGWAYANLGEFDSAVASCARALEAAPDPLSALLAETYLGYAHLEREAPDDAIALLERACGRFTHTVRFAHGRALGWLGEAWLAKGDVERARHFLTQALTIGRDVGAMTAVGWAQRGLGRVALAVDDLTEAERWFRAALATFTESEASYEMAKLHLLLAEVAHRRGDRASAVAHLGTAHGAFSRLGVPRYVTRTGQTAARLGLGLPGVPAATS